MRLTSNNIEFVKHMIVFNPWKDVSIVKMKDGEIKEFEYDERPKSVKNFESKHLDNHELFELNDEHVVFIVK